MCLGVGHGMLAEMEYRSCKQGIRPSHERPVDEVVQCSDPSRCDHRDADGTTDRPCELELVPEPGPVTVHRGEQDLPSTEFLATHGPFERIDSRWAPPAMG